MKSHHKVVIIQKVLSHYRRPFYELLRKRLADVDIELVLIHGYPFKDEARKSQREIKCARYIKNRI